MDLKWLLEIRMAVWQFLIVTILLAIAIAVWGPLSLRPNLSYGIASTPLSAWLLLVLDGCLAAIIVWLGPVAFRGFKWLTNTEARRTLAASELSASGDPDDELFGQMEHWEKRALAYFVVKGFRTLPRTTFLHSTENHAEIASALQRLVERRFLTRSNPPYNFRNDGGDYILREDLFRRLSMRPDLVGVDVPPRRFP